MLPFACSGSRACSDVSSWHVSDQRVGCRLVRIGFNAGRRSNAIAARVSGWGDLLSSGAWRALSPAERALQIDLLPVEGSPVFGSLGPQSSITPSDRL